MTDLERIEIEGFKGLESISFEPSGINLITGRNNTGKTSLLEAINLLFNPSNIGRFEDGTDRIININQESTYIFGETAESRMEVDIELPENEIIEGCFIRMIPNSFHRRRTISQSFFEQFRTEYKEQFNELESDIHRILQEELDNDFLTKLGEEFVVVTVNGDSYLYFSPGPKSEEVASLVNTEMNEKFGNSEEPDGLESSLFESDTDDQGFWQNVSAQDEETGSYYTIFGLGQIRPNRARGFLNKPTDADTVRFIESIKIADNIETEDDEKDAIKIDDIGDFIKEKELVDDLKTFDIDYLVFEKEDGEKYQIPYGFMGDGFKAIVGLLWELLDEKNKNEIVLIEEPENHMHPGYVSELVHFLIDLARDEDIQFFITTHDHDFIKDFFMDMPDEKREYLEEEFSLVKMDDFGADVLNYEDAEHHLKDLHLDLRGI